MKEKIQKRLDEMRGHWISYEDDILPLIREEIGKVENPFPEKRGFMAQFEAFEQCRQGILSLKSKYTGGQK
jgi:hypothetical protein